MKPREAKRRGAPRRQSVNVILTQSMPVHPLKSEQKLGEHARLRGHCALATVGPISHRATMGHPQRRAKVKVRNWQCALKARITCGGRSHPENCRLIW